MKKNNWGDKKDLPGREGLILFLDIEVLKKRCLKVSKPI